MRLRARGRIEIASGLVITAGGGVELTPGELPRSPPSARAGVGRRPFPSQRFQEPDELRLLERRQRLVADAADRGLPGVSQYRLVERERLRAAVGRRAGRAAVVH